MPKRPPKSQSGKRQPSPLSSPNSSGSTNRPWRVRIARRVLTEDVPQIGHDSYERAKKAIQKKLPAAPSQYGEMLHSPLHGLYKLKSSHVRVAYHIEEDTHEVWVLLIGDRRTIWNDRQTEILERLGEERRVAAGRERDRGTASDR